MESIAPVEETKEQVIDEVEEETKKFTSPEAGAERLSKLDPEILDALKLMTEDDIFSLFLSELKNKCNFLQSSQDSFSHERMWTQIVFSICMNFKREHFHSKVKLSHVPPKITAWFKDTNVVSILQTFVDISQQNGYAAKQVLMKLRETDPRSSKHQDTKELHLTQERFELLQNRYHDYVDLLKRCTGTWKPQKLRHPKHMKPSSDCRPEHFSGDKKSRFKDQRREHSHKDAGFKSYRP